jgi:hypothetical protein
MRSTASAIRNRIIGHDSQRLRAEGVRVRLKVQSVVRFVNDAERLYEQPRQVDAFHAVRLYELLEVRDRRAGPLM